VTALAVLNPHIRMSLRHGAAPLLEPCSRLLQTSGSNNLRTVCAEVLGGLREELATADMRVLQYRYGGSGGIQIGGVVSVRPQPLRDLQHLCVNRRYVAAPALALEIEVIQ
jgi:DNA mismatch repair ATPase MutL